MQQDERDPATGKGIFGTDLPAGIVVFLVALPLCLGVALASGAPPFSGIIAGVVGGLIVSWVSGSSLSVSGPAAGLTTIVERAIISMGFGAFQVAVVLAGLMQLAFGALRAGIIGRFFPGAVIKGMLSAIGILLIIKQIPHAMGNDDDFEGDFSFFQIDHENSLSEIFKSFSHGRFAALVIFAITLVILILGDRPFYKNLQKKVKKLRFLPIAFIGVMAGIGINQLFLGFAPALALEGDHLVNVPVAHNPGEFFSFFRFPDFSLIGSGAVWEAAMVLALVASLESLLSVEAVDKLDPQKRQSPMNRELLAQGTGNVISGMLGGLPITAVIVRSAANVNAGGQTRWSAFFHGILLLVCAAFVPVALNLIPNACLAAILILTGYKLVSVKVLREMYRSGWEQYLPFFVTIIGTVSLDLLKGVGLGLIVAIFLILRRNLRPENACRVESEEKTGRIRLILGEELNFLNKAALSKALEDIPSGSSVILDGTNTRFFDPDVIFTLREWMERAPHKGIDLQSISVPDMPFSVGHH